MYDILSYLVCSPHILFDDMRGPPPRQKSLIETFDLTRWITCTQTRTQVLEPQLHKKVTRKQTRHPCTTRGRFRELACEPFKSLVLDMDAFPTGGTGSYVAKMVSSNLQTKAPGVSESQPDSVLGWCEGRQECWVDEDESLLDQQK